MTKLPRELHPGPLEAVGLWKASRYLRRVKGILMADLVEQPTARPTNKVLTAGGGVAVGLLIWAAAKLGFDILPEDAGLIISAVGVLISYFVVKDRANTGPKSKP